MFLVIGFLLAGLLLGAIIKNYIKSPKIFDIPVNVALYLLLFTLGITAGSNEKITSQLHHLGITALLISIFIISCCAILAYFLFKYIFHNSEP
jgi:Kef-type K+ transport system membrane component KefB